MGAPKKIPQRRIDDQVRLTIKRLKKMNTPKSDKLAKKLERCRDDDKHNCCLAACRQCRGKTQQAFSEEIVKLFQKKASIEFFTVIPLDGRVAYTKIDDFDVLAFKRRHTTKIQRILSNNKCVTGGVDVSLNSHENGEKLWQFHLHFYLLGSPESEFISKLRKRFPKDKEKRILRPVQIESVPSKELLSNAAYVYKSFFTARSSFNSRPQEGGESVKYSFKQPLQADADKRLSYAFRKYKVFDLIISIGLKRARSSDPAKLKFKQTYKEGSGTK